MAPGNPKDRDLAGKQWEAYRFILTDGVLKVGRGTLKERKTGCIVAQTRADHAGRGLIEAMPPGFADPERFLAASSGGWELKKEDGRLYRAGQRVFLRQEARGKRLAAHAGEARAGESDLKVKWEEA